MRQELQKYQVSLLFDDAAWLAFSSPSLSAAIPLTSWSLQFPLSPFILLRWLPLATLSRHQMAKTGGRGDAPVSLSLYHLAAPRCHHFPVLILSHIPFPFFFLTRLTAHSLPGLSWTVQVLLLHTYKYIQKHNWVEIKHRGKDYTIYCVKLN